MKRAFWQRRIEDAWRRRSVVWPMPRLEAWLRPRLAEVLPGVAGRLDVLQFPNGSANLTYLLRIGTHERWALARFDDSPAEMDEIHGRLVRGMPAPSRVSIVHNDLKLDNCQFDPANPDRVTSIFDWDMTTLGDPLIDLGTLLNYWPDPADPPDASRASDPGLTLMGLPTRVEITARYASRTGVDVAAVRWWEAFALWKTVVVVQQLHRRWVRGESTDPRMARIADRVPALIAAARRVWRGED